MPTTPTHLKRTHYQIGNIMPPIINGRGLIANLILHTCFDYVLDKCERSP